MQALILLMADKPFPLIKVTEICKISDYNRGTFYRHYDNKDDLLNDLLEVKLEELNVVLEKVAKKNQPKQRDVNQLTPLFSYIYDNRYFFSVLLGEHKIIGFRLRLFEAYRIYLTPRIVEPLPSIENDPILKEIHLDFISSTWLGVSLFWITHQDHPSPEYVAEQFIKIIEISEHKIFSRRWRFKVRKENSKFDVNGGGAKEAFQTALIKLLMKKKYRMIRIQDILDISGYNRSSFYLHFTDKEDLFNSLRDELTAGMIQVFSNGPRDVSGLIGRDLPIVTLFDYLYENRELLKLMYGSKAVPGFFNSMFNVISSFFIEELSERVDVDKALYSNYLTTTLMTIIGAWFTKGLRYSPEFMAATYLDILHQPSVLD